MQVNCKQFESDGYIVLHNILNVEQCEELTSALPSVENSGTRTLLSVSTFAKLAVQLRDHKDTNDLLSGLVAVQCTLFQKTASRNWSVRVHRDLVVSVQGEGPWQSAGVKEGMQTAKPPRHILDECIAVRVQLDGAPVEDISVVPGSHRETSEHSRQDTVAVPVPRGGVMLLRPTLVHASSKLQQVKDRRVLHYLFATAAVPKAYRWYHAA